MIDINDVTFSYPGASHEVFTNFSCQISQGNILGLLGKNGTGKSTLLYLICGLLRCRDGQITVDGYESHLRLPAMLSEMFIVPEEYDLPPVNLSTYLEINLPFYPHFSREVFHQCLTDFELEPYLHLAHLSMGQKKKVYMSFAIAAGTKYLLMDEPTNGLDIPSKSQFRKVLAGNVSEGQTIIISTHQVHDVEQLLDHVVILSHGGLLLNLSVSDICSRYSFGYRMPHEMDDSVLYAEPTLQGNAVVTRRSDADPETPLNLELLFNATVNDSLI